MIFFLGTSENYVWMILIKQKSEIIIKIKIYYPNFFNIKDRRKKTKIKTGKSWNKKMKNLNKKNQSRNMKI